MNHFYIVTSGGLYGHYGKGATLDLARAAWKKAGGSKRKDKGFYIEQQFNSELPFVPHDRPATKDEADAWVGKDGSLSYVRCERVLLTQEEVGHD